MNHNWQEEYKSKSDTELYIIFKSSSDHSRIMREFAEQELKHREFNFKHIERRFEKMNGKTILSSIKYIETYGNHKWPDRKTFYLFGLGFIILIMVLYVYNLSILDFLPIIIAFVILAVFLFEIVAWLKTRKLMKLYEKFDKIINSP